MSVMAAAVFSLAPRVLGFILALAFSIFTFTLLREAIVRARWHSQELRLIPGAGMLKLGFMERIYWLRLYMYFNYNCTYINIHR